MKITSKTQFGILDAAEILHDIDPSVVLTAIAQKDIDGLSFQSEAGTVAIMGVIAEEQLPSRVDEFVVGLKKSGHRTISISFICPETAQLGSQSVESQIRQPRLDLTPVI